ncbi:hypothetical protein M501DRAFT_1016421 [Patellaria atrata CBS 101060]|uniref:RRM domain-containing protein n=1 Tax=Patellaria atrata CBS 101060 TaxID=1346257 RepID=A0A9P4SB35_9PEZI|nr:hypothetical protein M501DRAFT_1016421 [Patellaria atrata CBS 101060]
MSPLSDYTILPILLPPLPSYPHPSTHHIYVRPHAPSTPTRSSARSLFLANLPIDATEHNLRRLFKTLDSAAVVERVEFEGLRCGRGSLGVLDNLEVDGEEEKEERGKKRKRGDGQGKEKEKGIVVDKELWGQLQLPRVWDREILKSGSCGVVVFLDRAGAERGFKGARRAGRGKGVEWTGSACTTDEDGRGEGNRDPPLGVRRYETNHRLTYPPKSTLLALTNAYLSTFQAYEQHVARTRTQSRVPDKDGFVTVTRGARTGPARVEEALAAKAKMEEREKKRAGFGFYKFQGRDRRKEEERRLRDSFERDRERVVEMRRKRLG